MNKPILAIETSAELCSVCVYYDDNKYFEQNVLLKHSHAEKLFQLLESVQKSADIQLKEFDSIAVSEGPGSFTGLRIGYSAAKGLATGAGLPFIAVPTFEALAIQISEYLGNGSEFVIANKVNLEEIYFAKFHVKANSFIFAENLQILGKPEFVKRIEDLPVFGNASSDPCKSRITAPLGKYIARWAALYGKDKKTFEFDFIEPNYMKNFIIKEKKK